LSERSESGQKNSFVSTLMYCKRSENSTLEHIVCSREIQIVELTTALENLVVEHFLNHKTLNKKWKYFILAT
jgi:hypothetical protein